MEENTNPPVEQPQNNPPEPVEQSSVNDAAEWENAEKEVFGEPEPQSDLKPEETPKVGEQSQNATETTTTETTTAQTATPQTPTAQTTTAGTTTAQTTTTETTQAPAPTNLEEVAQRVVNRYSSQTVESWKNEIKSKLLPEPIEMKASDGFVVKSAKDLETIEDPRTPGQAFTPQEAQRVFNEFQTSKAQTERQVEEKAAKIAAVYQGLEDEATIAMAAYKDIFAENPELQQSVYRAYTQTLKTNEQGMVEEAPVSLLEFYHSVLGPYQKMRQSAPADPAAAPATPANPNQAPDNTQRNQDRSDIYKPTTSTLTKDEEEWAEAAREVLGVKK